MAQKSKAPRQKEIDVVLCADLSASTNGLIDDIKENFWNLINHNNTLKPAPKLRIGFVFYGRPSFGAKNNYVRLFADLTDSYDSLYMMLNELIPNIESGDQYVGAALQTAVGDLDWSKDKSTIKMIYLIGNGSVITGGANFEAWCDAAKAKKIIVHTIYCYSTIIEKEIKGWEKIAYLTNGKSSTIYVNKHLPSDANIKMKELWQLNKSLNNSFIYYGERGAMLYKNMTTVDSLTVYATNSTYSSRLLYKAQLSDLYLKNWDLISYSKLPGFDLYKVDRPTLPPEYSATAGPEMIAIITQKQADRDKAKKEIQLSLEHDYNDLITNRVLKEDIGDEGNLDRVIVKSYMKTAFSNGYTW